MNNIFDHRLNMQRYLKKKHPWTDFQQAMVRWKELEINCIKIWRNSENHQQKKYWKTLRITNQLQTIRNHCNSPWKKLWKKGFVCISRQNEFENFTLWSVCKQVPFIFRSHPRCHYNYRSRASSCWSKMSVYREKR